MSIYTPTYLYVKRHGVTGLLYFGKTKHHPEHYKGSGVYWQRHLAVHGDVVQTLWYHLYENPDELREDAEAFSRSHSIVESSDWANLMDETGFTGGYVPRNHFATVINHLPTDHPIIMKRNESISKAKSGISTTPQTEEIKQKKASTLKNKPIVTCPHCGRQGKQLGRFLGYHFDNCKSRS